MLGLLTDILNIVVLLGKPTVVIVIVQPAYCVVIVQPTKRPAIVNPKRTFLPILRFFFRISR